MVVFFIFNYFEKYPKIVDDFLCFKSLFPYEEMRNSDEL